MATVEAKTDFTETLKTAAAEAQVKAKTAFAKASLVANGLGEFTKGNAEAVVESGKILASGMKKIGEGYVAEGRTALDTLGKDAKAFTAIKSPADLFKLQSDLLRRNVESAFAFGSKTSQASLKLADEAFAPISGRINLAVEKIRKAA